MIDFIDFLRSSGSADSQRYARVSEGLRSRPLEFVFNYLTSIFNSDTSSIHTNELLFLAYSAYTIPLSIISGSKKRVDDVIEAINSFCCFHLNNTGFKNIDVCVDTVSKIYYPANIKRRCDINMVQQLAHTARIVQSGCIIEQGKNPIDRRFLYPPALKTLSSLLNFELLNDRYFFPFSNTVGEVKCNVFLRDVIIDALACNCYFTSNFVFTALTLVRSGITHNFISACILYFLNLEKSIKNDPSFLVCVFNFLMLFISGAEGKGLVEDLSALLKVLGAANSDKLIHFCEVKTLSGKTSATPDFLSKDLAKRITLDCVNNKCFIDSTNLLKLRHVLHDLYKVSVRPFEPITVHEYWAKRWSRVKSGSHKVRDEKEACGTVVTEVVDPSRRNFVEARCDNPLFQTRPLTLISQSIKYENGKNRAIYSCDTINYLNFDYFCMQIEENWINPRILLKPSEGADHKMHSEIFKEDGIFYFSLDYDDFNSQHSLIAMREVVSVFSQHFDENVRAWLCSSFDNMFLSISKEKWLRGLPSGHRLTSFINSILNYAYLAMVTDMDAIQSKHTGDDCIIFMDSLCKADVILTDLYAKEESADLRINKNKQSLGNNGEFLRYSYNKTQNNRVRSYYTRSVASLVNGSWTSSYRLNFSEYIDSLSGILHTIRTRLRTLDLHGLSTTVRRRIFITYNESKDYLNGVLSINHAPIVNNTGSFNCIDIQVNCKTVFKNKGKKYASTDYYNTLSQRMPIIFKKISKYKKNLINMMANLSLIDHREVNNVVLKRYKVSPSAFVKVDMSLVMVTNRMDGYLAKIMPFPLLRSALEPFEVSRIMNHLGKEIFDYARDVWGVRSSTVLYNAFISYKDLKMAGHCFEKTVIVTSVDVSY